ncbi:MAG TPA: hypothetical protein VGA40_07870 [Candidatus Acidoferrales bacterium]
MQQRFESSIEARDFFIQKVVEQASREGVSLSDDDRFLLGYSTEGVDEDSSEMEVLEDKFDDALGERLGSEYESMVAGLLQRAFEYETEMAQRMGLPNPRDAWRSAFEVLTNQDHYLTVVIERGIGKKLRRKFLGLF